MDDKDDKKAARGFRRESDGPKNGPGEDLAARIAGLEKSKTYPDMTRQDIAALDRMIAKLKFKLAEKNPPKTEEEQM